ncbi:MAG: endonuclease/exonuclease/phosphatase family protein [Solirubrobacteraceae bacterium]
MRLVSWNVAGRVRRLDEQAAAIAGEVPDLVVLQESRGRPFLAGGRRSEPWVWRMSAPPPTFPAPLGRRGLAVLLAWRWPLAVLPSPEALPWPERALNTPRREHPDGTVWTLARESRGALRPERGERWDAADGPPVGPLGTGRRPGYRRDVSTWAWMREHWPGPDRSCALVERLAG